MKHSKAHKQLTAKQIHLYNLIVFGIGIIISIFTKSLFGLIILVLMVKNRKQKELYDAIRKRKYDNDG